MLGWLVGWLVVHGSWLFAARTRFCPPFFPPFRFVSIVAVLPMQGLDDGSFFLIEIACLGKGGSCFSLRILHLCFLRVSLFSPLEFDWEGKWLLIRWDETMIDVDRSLLVPVSLHLLESRAAWRGCCGWMKEKKNETGSLDGSALQRCCYRWGMVRPIRGLGVRHYVSLLPPHRVFL